ncbi:MgtC/SapB family protein [uncultured Proteiniphilum sp.]|uniref:MgtC/SapB family protein n=1 Tax=uncultured Proteiniphilum sp. TaxID=497637 RepID=UPI002639E051|nr:MgtC/SapB family protein [uncultured Proteiniphilum sp.]
MMSLEFVIRLLAATVAGGTLGLERESNNKSAGLRTNTLVAVGASIFVMISTRILEESTGDPTRVVGQIVTGIGFLGAGVILHQGSNVKGLTTAATVWCSAALGCLAGFGMYWELAASTLLVILINTVFKKTDKWFPGRKP